MHSHRLTRSVLVALASLAVGTACGSFRTERAEGVQRVDDLLARVECVQVDAVVSKEAARNALNEISGLCSPDFGGNPEEAYAAFVEKIETSEKQAQALHQSVEPMTQTAEAIFAKWAADLQQFGNTTMRQRSQTRLDDTRARYQAVYSAAQSAMASFDAYNADLRDHALFLEHDLNATAVAELQNDVKDLENSMSALDARLDQVSNAARLYVESTALHGQVAESAPPAAEPAPESTSKSTSATKTRSSTLKKRGTAAKTNGQTAPPTSSPVTEPSPVSNPTPGAGSGSAPH